MEQVEFWTYTSKDGNIHICFDKQQKYIEVTEKDVRGMMGWLLMDKGCYYPGWYEDLTKRR